MFYPSKNDYLARSENYNLIPVYKEYIVDTETPTSIFMKTVGLEKRGFLLESVEGLKNLSRYSFIGFGCKNLIKFDEEVFSFDDGSGEVYETLFWNWKKL